MVHVGSAWTGVGAVYDVARHLRYHGAQQPPAPQSSSAASLCLLCATSGTALTSSSAPVAPPVFVPHPQHAAVASVGCVVRGRLFQPAAHHARAVTSLPLLPFPTPVPLHFALLRTGLCGHSERQWKETVG